MLEQLRHDERVVRVDLLCFPKLLQILVFPSDENIDRRLFQRPVQRVLDPFSQFQPHLYTFIPILFVEQGFLDS